MSIVKKNKKEQVPTCVMRATFKAERTQKPGKNKTIGQTVTLQYSEYYQTSSLFGPHPFLTMVTIIITFSSFLLHNFLYHSLFLSSLLSFLP